MARGTKMVVALGLTVALHVVVAIYALGPRLSGLTAASPPAVEAAGSDTTAPVADPKAAPDDAKTKTAAEAPLDVALVQNAADARPPTPAAEPAPKPEVEAEEKPSADEKPVTPAPDKVVTGPAVEKPAGKTPESALPAKSAEKPLAKPADQKAERLAAKKAAALEAAEASKKAAAAEAAKKAAAADLAKKAAAAKLAAAKPEPKPAAAAAGRPAVAGASAAAPAALSSDAGYANRVRQHLAKFAGALPPGANGEARVQFVVQTDGRVTDVHLVRFSGNVGLDTVALKLPTQAQPLPLPGATPQRLEVPVQATATAP